MKSQCVHTHTQSNYHATHIIMNKITRVHTNKLWLHANQTSYTHTYIHFINAHVAARED